MPDYLIRKDSGELELVTGTEPFVVSPSFGPGSYNVYRLDNSASVILQGAGDVQAPSLANLSAAVANNQATLNWFTDEAGGTTHWVCTEASTAPTTSQIIAGQDHTGAPAEASGAQPVVASGAQSTAPVDGLQDGQTYSFHLMHRDADGNASATLTATVIVPFVAPVLSGVSATGEGTTATLSYTTTEGSGGMYWVVTSSAQTPESWRIKREEDHEGSPALAAGSQRPTTAGEQPDVVVTGLTAGGTYHFHMYHRANNETSDIASASVTLEGQVPVDITAPSLSAVSASSSGNTATLTWATDEGNGTGYWVCTTAPTVPTEAQIIAGQDHSGAVAVASGAQSVSDPGAQVSQAVSGLSSGSSYFFHLLHRDASDNTSTRVSTTGVTVASSGVSAKIGIINRSVTETAPEALVFDVSLAGFDTLSASPGEVYDPQFHDLYYYWDFGDSYEFQAPEKLIPQYLNSGTAYGPKVSHTFRAAGVYTVSCLIVEPSSGKSTTAQLSVTIGDENAQYPGTATVFVDATGAGSGAPEGALIATSLEAAFSSVYTGSATRPRRIMLARGQTFTPSALETMGMTAHRLSSLICAAPGTGAKPVINTANATLTWGWATGATIDADLKIQNVVFQGPYDVTTQTGTMQTCVRVFENRPKQLLIDGCEFRGYDLGVYPTNTSEIVSADPYIIVNDTVMTDYRSACLFGDVNWAGSGNRMAQNPGALCGYAGANNNLISCVRFASAPNVIWHQNDMFSRTGWWNATVAGIYDLQSCFRGNTGSLAGAFYNVNCNVFEGGVASFSIDIDDSDTSNPINAVVEKNMTIGYHDSYRSMEFGFGGITVRNNICIIPDGVRYGVPLYEFLVFKRRTSGGDNAANRNAPVQVYNNSFVCLTSAGNVAGGPIPLVQNGDGYADVTVSNNVSHQPNRGGGVDNLDATVLWSPRYTHYADDNTPRDNSKATPENTIATYGPQIGSDVLGDALSGTVAYDDFLGNIRPQYPSRGALEIS